MRNPHFASTDAVTPSSCSLQRLTWRSSELPSAVVQELMETDMHRVIRTQDLSDDHAQVRACLLSACLLTHIDADLAAAPLPPHSTLSTRRSARSRRCTRPTSSTAT